jgi:hypothetical protein
MPGYKDTLLAHLSAAGWEQVEVFEISQWWGTEVWRIRSTTISWGFELFLSFLVDPHPGAGDVWEVGATTKDPCDGAGGESFARICTKLKYLVPELPRFLQELDQMRRAGSEEEEDAEQDGRGQPATRPDPK